MAGLSISRKAGQTVVIESPGFALVINVERTSRGKVDLKFLGPPEVRILRGELFAACHGFDAYDRLINDNQAEAQVRQLELQMTNQMSDMVAFDHSQRTKGTDAAQTAAG